MPTISVKTTEAPAFRRVSIQRRVLEERGLDAASELLAEILREASGDGPTPASTAES